jgi:hypothetical protein
MQNAKQIKYGGRAWTRFAAALGLLAQAAMAFDPDAAVPPGSPTAPEAAAPDAELTAHALAAGPAPVDNPLKGFAYWYFPNDNPDAKTTPTTLEWHYFGLGDVMRGIGNFDWEPVEKYLDEVASHGKQACLRFSTNIAFGGKEIPDFLMGKPRQDGNLPYDDPEVMAAFLDFIKAFGAKYDGDARIGFIHMGLVGKWGEWHTWPYEGKDGAPNLMPSDANCNRIIEAYDAAFRKTRLEIRYARVGGGTTLAKTGRIGFHDDSFCYREYDPELGKNASMTLPLSLGGKTDGFVKLMLQYGVENRWMSASVGGEVRPEIQGMLFDAASNSKDDPVQDIEVAHATWMICNNCNFPATQEAAMNGMRVMGYQFQVLSAYFKGSVSGQMKVGVRIQNNGVAPFYYGPDTWPVLLCVKDAAGKIVKTWKTDWDLRKILPAKIRALPEWKLSGNPVSVDFAKPAYFQSAFDAADVPKGDYTLAMRVFNPLENVKEADVRAKNHMPSWMPFRPARKLRFANQGQGEDGWLALGGVAIGSAPTAIAAPSAKAGAGPARLGASGTVRFRRAQKGGTTEVFDGLGKRLPVAREAR